MIQRPDNRCPALLDLHVHSTCSADGVSSILDHAERARDLGLLEVGFCEHVDLDPRDRDYGYLCPAKYDREISAARSAVAGVELRQGVEMTYQNGRRDEVRNWLASRSWDLVILSIHLVDYVDGWAIISEPTTTQVYFAAHTLRQAYEPYFEELLRASRSGLGDVLGHFDLVKRYGTAHFGPFEPAFFKDEIRQVLRSAIEGGMGLEINTSGWRQSPGEPYPALDILRWYHELGGEVLTIGSDAHHVDDLGAGITQAQEMARAAGFRAITSFKKRQAYWLDL